MKKVFALALGLMFLASTANASLIQNATKDQQKVQTVQQLKKLINQQYQQLQKTMAQSWALVWNNPTLKPQEVFDAVGTDGAQLCQISTAAAEFLNTIAPNTVSVETPQTVIVNDDGTVALK